MYLYRKCLEARSDLTNQINEKLNEEYAIRYFNQLRTSYLQIINSHFKSLKYYFYPWILIDKNEQKDFDLAIKGSIDFDTPAINFQFLKIKKDSESPKLIVATYEGTPSVFSMDNQGNKVGIPIMTMNQGDSWHLNLTYTQLGIDSAREVALHTIKKQLADILDKQNLFDIEPPEMIVMQIEGTLSKLPQQFWITKENVMFRPSLYSHPIDEIIDVFLKRDFMGYLNTLGNFGYLTREKVLRMYMSLCRLQELKIKPIDYLLPKEDINPTEIQNNVRYWWELWSDKQITNRIARFYESYQLSYRYLVENYFPSIKNNLPLYVIGPIRFNITVGGNRREMIRNHGGGIEVTWEPVEDINDIKTNICEDYSKKLEEPLDYHNQIERNISQNLFRLGRKRLPFYSRKNSLLSLYFILDNELRKDIYKQLKADLGYILGDL